MCLGSPVKTLQLLLSLASVAAGVQGGAWKRIPSWYNVALEDRAINPELERFYAKRNGATTMEIKSSHVPFLSHPKEVVTVIETAAAAPNVRPTQ